MYLSHPVRRIRDEPDPEATVALVVELADDDAGNAITTLRTAVDAGGGHLGRDLGFGCHLVVVPEPAVETLCTLDWVERIETDATVSMDVDVPPEAPADADGPSVEDLREHLEE